MKDVLLYEEFLRRKSRRPLFDAYACFQPFNEASRAFFPFIDLLKKEVKPGDTILNLWDRSGWFTSLLAGLFPEQQILTTWEGDNDVLGHKGYAFWFSGPGRPANVQILFHDLHRPLPLPDNSVNLVVGMDVLHRYNLPDFCDELIRVLQSDGGLLFPHVHLANAEPTPYFKRGGQLRTGLAYEQAIHQLNQLGERRAFIFSEPDLFQFNTRAPANTRQPITSSPETPDYNALIAILPAAWAERPLVPFRMQEDPAWASSYVLLNNLITIDYSFGLVQCRPEGLAGVVGHLLDRHPVYSALIRASDGYVLSETALCFLYWAARQLTIADIATRLNEPIDNLRALVSNLAQRDLIQLVPIRESGARLQHYLSFQQYEGFFPEQTLPALWKRAVSLYDKQVALLNLEDDSTFSYADADQLISQIRGALRDDGLQPGNRVLIVGQLHVESLLLCWACWQSGLTVVPISPDVPAPTLMAIATIVQPSLLVTAPNSQRLSESELPTIWLDADSDEVPPTSVRWFADWISQDIPAVELVRCTADDVAAILFTSGSTGQPKGVPLTHGQLYRSGRLTTETFRWDKTDRFLAVGNLDSMSGLRNVTSAIAEVGAAVIIPATRHRQSGATLAEAAAAGQATLLTASPSLLRQWVQYDRRVAAKLQTLRLVMSTGSALTTDLRQAFRTAFACPVLNYYGLTETAGICLTERPDQQPTGVDTIGWPVGCLAQVVDDQHCPVLVGQTGELRIYSDNNLSGDYIGHMTESPVVQGWLYTGDLAIINPDGSFTLCGRKSERIKNAYSEVVYPAEIEAQLLTHQIVQDAAVCSFVRHDTETLAAFLTVNADEVSHTLITDISAHLQERVGPHKLPSVFRILDKIPRTAGGKVAKHTLLALLNEE